jgi:DNA mismatch endonuclease (patch repair protein)
MGVRVRSTKRRLPGSPDLVSIKGRWAVQVNGCFWHQHSGCVRATMPKRNRALWEQKFAANLERDHRLASKLREMGFRVLVIWECEVEERPAYVATRLGRFVARCTD